MLDTEFELFFTANADGRETSVSLDKIHGIFKNECGLGVVELKGNHPVIVTQESQEQICDAVRTKGFGGKIIGCDL